MKNCIYLLIINLIFVFAASAEPQKIFICSYGTVDDPITVFAKLKRADFNGANLTTIRTGARNFISGCHYDSTVDKIYLLDVDPSDGNFKIFRISPDNSSQSVLQYPIPGENNYNILGSFAVDNLSSTLFWPDSTNWEIKFASSINPLVLGANPMNIPQIMSFTPGNGVSAPYDLEIDPYGRKLYIGNGNGNITRIDLDGGESEIVVSGGSPVKGIALDPVHDRLFYTFENNQVFRSALNGSNPIELTDAIGPRSDPSHILADIDYDVDTDKIYWLESSDPNPQFGLLFPPGKLRRANPDGTNPEDVIVDAGHGTTFLTFQYGTLKPRIEDPRNGRTYTTEFPLGYNLGEAPSTGTVKVLIKKSGNTVASMTMIDSQNVTAIIKPFQNNVNLNGLVTASSGFPLSEGTYSLELSYQDEAGNAASSTTVENIVLNLPTPTPSVTPTVTNTPTSTSIPEATPVANQTLTPVQTISTPSALPTSPTSNDCVSSAELPLFSIKKKKAVLTLTSSIKGTKYQFFANPVGIAGQKPLKNSVVSSKNGKLSFAFKNLKPGNWEFSYSKKLKKVITKSCPTQKIVI